MANRTRDLVVTHEDGTEEVVQVYCGRHIGARYVCRRIGRLLAEGQATAVNTYDGKRRTAVRIGPHYYTRIAGYETGEGG